MVKIDFITIDHIGHRINAKIKLAKSAAKPVPKGPLNVRLMVYSVITQTSSNLNYHNSKAELRDFGDESFRWMVSPNRFIPKGTLSGDSTPTEAE